MEATAVTPFRLYLIAGEDSGDLHAGNLVRALQAELPQLMVRGMGGDRLQQAGAELSVHLSEGNYMGFWEVLRHLRQIRGLFRRIRKDVGAWQPHAVVMVDYPAFNLRLAPFFHALGIPIYYYISPQLWAWKKGRVKTIRRYVERMLVILPFEKEFYQQEGVDVSFVGHPLLDAIGDIDRTPTTPPTLALLPGSRKQEIQRMLPVMLTLREAFPEYRIVVAGAPSQPEAFYRQLIGEASVELYQDRTYELLREASLAAVTSGTATLETALFQVPEVVCYRGSRLSYAIGKRLVKVPFISLVNLILGREAVKELIQHECTPARLQAEMRRLQAATIAQRLQADYTELRQRLGEAGASERAAKELVALWQARGLLPQNP